MGGVETILIVDDELLLQTFLSEMLTLEGYNLLIAEDGQDAVAKYKCNMDLIDLVLMDIMMPVKDGITAHDEILAINPNAKIILMSGFSSLDFGEIGDRHFVQKPVLPSKLYATIRKILDLNRIIPLDNVKNDTFQALSI